MASALCTASKKKSAASRLSYAERFARPMQSRSSRICEAGSPRSRPLSLSGLLINLLQQNIVGNYKTVSHPLMPGAPARRIVLPMRGSRLVGTHPFDVAQDRLSLETNEGWGTHF
jgi:hypothetical protein